MLDFMKNIKTFIIKKFVRLETKQFAFEYISDQIIRSRTFVENTFRIGQN